MDEHWYLTPYHVGREEYYTRPNYPLKGVNVGAEDYVAGPLEDWTRGSLRLNGRDQYAVLPNARLTRAFEYHVTRDAPEWGTATVPVGIMPGRRARVEVRLRGVDAATKLRADLHWNAEGGEPGGVNTWGGPGHDVTGEGPYVFWFDPRDESDLAGFTVTVFLTPTGEWEDHTRVARVAVPKGEARGETRAAALGGGRVTETRRVRGPHLRNPQVHTSSFLIEVYFRTAPGQTVGVLAEKLSDAGYSLSVNDEGGVTFSIAGQGHARRLRSRAVVNDGEWHHLIAEADRAARELRLYVDGRRDATGGGVGPEVTLVNNGDLYVGGTPGGRCMKGAIDFARIALGTLADSRTTIEELCAWQFNGPFLRDFAGREPVGRRDAGALEHTE
jgi:hypothetical protein